jgi:5-(carboxyamino)imidazole ribonucleotide mutase
LKHKLSNAETNLGRLVTRYNLGLSTFRTPQSEPLVAIIMGSKSDWDTMRHASEMLETFEVAHESKIVSAHRTPGLLAEYAASAEQRGIQVIIAGAGGAAHLPGMAAAQTMLPVLGVPVESASLKGMDSLLSIVQMPAGVPVGTLAIGTPGAKNAALLAIAILSASRPELREKLRAWRKEQTDAVLQTEL